MQKNPKISIVLVSYNQGAFIEKAIKSYIEQNYVNKELIVIDGGSTDNTSLIIEKYKTSIDYFVSEKDCGMYHARNKGIFHTTGDIVGFLNCDDLFSSNCFEEVVKVFINSENVSMVFGITKAINIQGKIHEKLEWGNFCLNKSNYFGKMKTIPDQSTFYSKRVFSLIGLYETRYRFGADSDLKCRIIKNNLNIMQSRQVLAFWRIHEDTLTHRPNLKWKRFKEAIEINKKYNATIFSYYNIRLAFYYIILDPIKNILKK